MSAGDFLKLIRTAAARFGRLRGVAWWRKTGRRLFQRRWARIAGYALGSVLVTMLAVVLSFLFGPIDRRAMQSGFAESYRIYDRDNRLLRETVSEEGGPARWVKLTDIAPAALAAAVAVEDEQFYEHAGVDLAAILRASAQNVSNAQIVSGASTIDMQLARLLFRRSHSFFGKLCQVHDALRLNLYLDKDTILLNYMNRAPFGVNVTGIEQASWEYFSKPSRLLSLAESSLLAGVPQSPLRLDPRAHFPEAKQRQAYVLERMAKTGKITEAERQIALREPISILNDDQRPSAMHFTDYVLSLNPPRGDVHTTLCGNLNDQIELIVRDHVDVLAQGGLTNAACVVLDNADGSILALVGSADYWEKDSGMVNGVLCLRQPGSTLKPFLYALAFENGFSPVSVLPDVRTEYLGRQHELYVPENYTRTFHGPVPAKEALVRSLNVPAVYLTNRVGVYPLLSTLRDAGLPSLDRDEHYYGLGLILGNGEVSLLELTQAFALFPRQGRTVRAKAVPLLEAGKAKGERQLFTPQTCFLISHILTDENLRFQAYGYSNPLITGFPIAVKTGTSSNWRDNWVIGYTAAYTIGVWAGDFRGNPMNQLSGIIGAGPLFNKIARLVVSVGPHRGPPTYPAVPAGVENVRVCKTSGLTAGPDCPETMTSFILQRAEPLPRCDMHRKIRIDKRNGLLASPKCPARYVEEKVFAYLPAPYATWQKDSGIVPPPTRSSPLSPLAGVTADALVVTASGEIYIIEPGYDAKTQSIRFRAEVDPPLAEVDWIVDGKKAATVGWPYSFVWPLKKGRHAVQVADKKSKSDCVYFDVR
jgi:penicillin-binding protein 1C